MSLLGADGKPAEKAAPQEEKQQAAGASPAEASKEKAQEGDGLDKPMLGIDGMGNLTLFIPLRKTNQIFARGMIDVCRSELLKWYARAEQEQRQVQALSQKGALSRFASKLMGR